MSEDINNVLFEEKCVNNDSSVIYSIKGEKVKWRQRKREKTLSSLKQILRDIFLPKGYPDSVSEDYTWYQIWDTAQACCSTLSGMLAVQSVLLGVGVGRESASPLAAALTWFTKDGVGMVTGIGFAWLKGTKLDSECKKWRLFADFANDAALCLELSISIFLDYSVIILCISSALKSVVGVAGGATRAALTHHQAAKGNTADVAAKDGSQETLVNLITMSVGIWLINTSLVQNNVWLVMTILVVLHLWCNFRAVKSLQLRKINEERFLLILKTYFVERNIPSVTSVNLEESVIVGFGVSSKNLCGFSIFIGESIRDISLSASMMEFLIKHFRDKSYILVPDLKRECINVCLKMDIQDKDIPIAFFHSFVMGSFILEKLKDTLSSPKKLAQLTSAPRSPLSEFKEDDLISAVESSHKFLSEEINQFVPGCKKEGFILDEHFLQVQQYRINEKKTK